MPRSLYTAALLVVLLASCAPPVDVGKEEQQAKDGLKLSPRMPLTVKYQGMNAAQWTDVLRDADQLRSQSAIEPLGAIGEEAVPYLEQEALYGKQPHVRVNAIEAFPERLASAYQKTWSPIFKELLKDFEVRNRTAYKIGVFKYTDLKGDLTEALKTEKHDNTASTIRAALKKLE